MRRSRLRCDGACEAPEGILVLPGAARPCAYWAALQEELCVGAGDGPRTLKTVPRWLLLRGASGSKPFANGIARRRCSHPSVTRRRHTSPWPERARTPPV